MEIEDIQNVLENFGAFWYSIFKKKRGLFTAERTKGGIVL